MIFKKTGAALALTAACAVPVQASAANMGDCTPREQLVELGVALLPMVTEQATTQCATFLPSDSVMMTKGPAALERYKAAAEPVSTSAGNTLKSMIGDAIPEALPGDVVLPFVEAMAADKMAGMFDAKTCGYANNVWSPLSALPAYEMSSLLISIVSVVSDAEGEKDKSEQDKDQGKDKEQSPVDNPFDGLKICPYIDGVQAT